MDCDQIPPVEAIGRLLVRMEEAERAHLEAGLNPDRAVAPNWRI